MKDRIKQLNTEIQKLTSDAKTLYEDMDRKSEKGVKDYDGRSDDLPSHDKRITSDAIIKHAASSTEPIRRNSLLGMPLGSWMQCNKKPRP